MKKINFLSLFIVTLCLSATPAAAQKKKVQRQPEKPYPIADCGAKKTYTFLRISGFKEYPPFSWAVLDEPTFKATGQRKYAFEGFIAESLKHALDATNISNLREMAFDDYDEAKKLALHGQLDLLFTTYYQDEAKSGQDYIYPSYFGNPFVVISRKTKPIKIQDVSDLSGLKGVVRREEGVEALVKGILPTDTKLDIVDGPEKALKALLSGEVDFMISSPYATIAEARRFKVLQDIHIDKKMIRHIQFFASFSKLSPCRQYKKHFSEQFSPQFADKAESEKRMQKFIDKWADLHEDTPKLEFTPPEGG